jgi:hypothetical protein
MDGSIDRNDAGLNLGGSGPTSSDEHGRESPVATHPDAATEPTTDRDTAPSATRRTHHGWVFLW